MQTVRTPDERFADLPDFPFAPHFVEVDDDEGGTLRVHHLDEGPADGPVVLLMHGEPTWSFLYRHMVPTLVDAGFRVVAPDLVGFGRSDKPTEQSDHTYARHVGWMRQALFDRLDLRGITFFGQDWGGLIGLRLVAAEPDRYARVVVGNTGLPTGQGAPSDAFLAWQEFSQTTEHFPVGGIINGGCATDLAPEVVAAYDAPFPDDSYKAGARIMPALVPTSTDDPASADNQAAWEVLAGFDRPFLCAFSDGDPITKGGDAPFRAKVPGAQGRDHPTIEGGGHFLQEDRGPELARVIVAFVRETS
ncbi:haloalkane dehalogenase [Iamia majanohamensis]|uniref:Haloalkane dehalogenase n=1 Tax=Iamia majanohamensis TaxID=467976 RepID=A0AAE9Y5N0_9ACTN|nr:haloalkane dehalogenase [Iamia majanohamensis]WCO66912.1 haloalkane dehalogenase [Iamia majanohamensis]